MRDIAVLAFLLISMPICAINPYYGIVLWYFVSIFAPHRFTFGFAYHLPVAYMVAVPTLLGALRTMTQWNRGWLVRESALLMALWSWFIVTTMYVSQETFFSNHAESTVSILIATSKILFMTFVTMLLVNSRERFRYLLWTVAVSLGMLAIKGALFGMRTGGESRVWGPPDTFLADNNDFGLGMNMCLPIFYFLGQTEEGIKGKIWKISFYAGIFCVILTYSRGALLGLAAVFALITLKSRHKFASAVFVVICAVLVLSYAPEAWMDRMSGLAHGKVDSSAEERLISWSVAINLTKDYPITGGGFDMFADPVPYQRYQMKPLPRGHLSSGPHSIYFQTLGEQGYIGLILFVSLLISCLSSLRTLRNRCKKFQPMAWAVPYANMLQISLVAYMVSGAFLGRAYFDFFYLLVALVVILKVLFRTTLLRAVETEGREQEMQELTELQTAQASL